MQIYKADKKNFRKNEIKRWLWTITLVAILFFGIKNFSIIKDESITLGIILIFLFRLRNTFIPYHINEIRIDEQTNQISLKLNSKMSGEKIVLYRLDQANSELVQNTGLIKYFSTPFALEIFSSPENTYLINNRFGFTFETLEALHKRIKLANSQV